MLIITRNVSLLDGNDVDGLFDLLVAVALQYADHRRDIGIVPAIANDDMVAAGNDIVGGVELR